MNRIFLIVLLSVGLPGCGEGPEGPDMAPVSGIITLDGKPLPDAEVVFVGETFEGYGRTNEEGHYSLVRGAPIGNCKVYVMKKAASGTPGSIDMSIEGMDEEQMRAMSASGAGPSTAAKPLLPPEYSDPKLTRLTIEVPLGGTESADFNL